MIHILTTLLAIIILMAASPVFALSSAFGGVVGYWNVWQVSSGFAIIFAAALLLWAAST